MKYKLIIRGQSLEEEFNYLCWVINDLPFYKKNNYTVSLPENKLFLDLIKEKELDKEKLFNVFKKEIYNPDFFKLGIENLEKCRSIFDEASKIFEEMNKKWGFRLFKEYDVFLTAYGSGGSYDFSVDKAKIVMLTTADGKFKINPLENIIHETIHLGVEENVVRKFKLEHWEKEDLVDSICFLKFKKLISDYRYQLREKTKIRDYINNKTIENIPEIIKKYVSDNLRAKNVFYIMTGLPYSGKTTLVNKLLKKINCKVISADEILKEKGFWKEKEPIQKDWQIAYDEACERVRGCLASGENVIFDESNLCYSQRENLVKIAQNLGIKSKLIYVKIDKKEALKRWKENSKTKQKHQLNKEIFKRTCGIFEEPNQNEQVIVYNQDTDFEKWIKRNF